MSRLPVFKSLILIPFFLLTAHMASATSPTMGAEISVLVARKMFASPPLPNLDGGGVSVSANYGYAKATSKLSEAMPNGTPITSSGGAAGNTGGLGVSIPTNGDLGYFGFVQASNISGETIVNQGGTESYRISNIKAETYTGAGGLSYRLVGTDKSIFAMAPFVGPYYIHIHSTSDFVPTLGGGSSTNFTVDPRHSVHFSPGTSTYQPILPWITRYVDSLSGRKGGRSRSHLSVRGWNARQNGCRRNYAWSWIIFRSWTISTQCIFSSARRRRRRNQLLLRISFLRILELDFQPALRPVEHIWLSFQ
jgi:hypothetical protein